LPEDFGEYDEKIGIDFQPKFIQKIVKIGEVSSLEMNLYEVNHRSENDPRISLSRDSFRLLAHYSVKRALILFISQNSLNYRLSLVTIDLKWEEGKRVQKEYSNPRRYSFFLGPETKTHTPETYLIKKGRVKDFDDLKERFSLEIVNKDFYKQIAILFTKLAGGERTIGRTQLDEKGSLYLPSTTDDKIKKEFSVRLIGRLVFCWFLKKKCSDKGTPLLPEELLSSKAVTQKPGFYHNILEPLFFETLNTPIKERKKEYQIPPWSQIPFLNGGLFANEYNDYYEIDQLGISKYINTLKVPDSWLKELFEIFEIYNFTIDENTSMDVELSIEPEMLGRIFENLLAEINPETGNTARKATGSYYTPRPIVEYMVDESLKQYLLTKTNLDENKISSLLAYEEEEVDLSESEKDAVIDALDVIKIIDPACGSGAFPMGILQKMLLILQKIDPESKKWLNKKVPQIENTIVREEFQKKIEAENWNYVHKLGIIQNSIYGVDIQPIAVDISKLRFFLSLIVDEKVDDSKENRGIDSLPNLEFKFVCANSLIGLPNTLVGSYKKGLQPKLFEAVDNITELKKLREEYLRCVGNEKKLIEKKFQEIQSEIFLSSLKWLNWGGGDSQTVKLSQWNPFSGEPCEWFDPDWMFGIKDGFDVVIGNPPYIFSRENISHEEKNIYKTLYKLTQFKINIYILFIEKGYYLLKVNSGSLFFITPNNWLTLNTNSDLRKFLLINTGDIQILQNYANVFESASVDTVIVGFKKSSNHILKYLEWVDKKPTLKHVKDASYYLNLKEYIISDMVESLDSKQWPLKNEVKTLEEIAFVKNGVQAYTVGEGTPMCTKEMKEKRVYHSKTKKDNNWIKYLDGVDVSRYYFGWSGQFIKYGKNLSRPREVKLFIGKRILVRQIPSQLPYCLHACYVDEYVINDNNSMIIKVIDDERNLVKYILGVLNSSFISLWFAKKFGKLSRKIFPQFKVKELRTFPIPVATIEIQRQFEKIVNCILFCKKNPQYSLNSIFFEHLVDAMVYELYFPNEIKAADVEVLKYLSNLPELIDDWSDEKKLEVIEKVCKELSHPKHPVAIAMEKQKTVPEVRIIEGLPALPVLSPAEVSEVEGDK
jgi:hypothetical protein